MWIVGRSGPLWIVSFLLVFMVSTAPAAAAQSTEQEQVNAAVEPALVQLVVEWTGYIHNGESWSDEIVATAACTGFFVSDVGHVVTAGHCVDPVEGRRILIDEYLDQAVQEGFLLPEDVDFLRPVAYIAWVAEGLEDGAPIERMIYATQPKDVEGTVLHDERAVAQLLDFRSFEEGDIALLKLAVTDTPALPVASQEPQTGAPVTSVGFSGAVRGVTGPERTPRASFKTGSISSQQIQGTGVPVFEINADVSGGMSGGPTIDTYGNVLGVNSFGVSDDEQVFITGTADLRSFLERNSVPLAPVHAPGSPTWIFAIVAGAGVLFLAAAGLLVWHRVRRSRPATTPAPPPGPPTATPVPVPAEGALGPPASPPATLALPPAPPAEPPAETVAGPPQAATLCGCGHQNAATANFCANCGTRLAP